MRKGEFGLFR